MTAKLTGDEQEQILQTIEMFEVIAKSYPDDYQSLTLLRDAYTRLGRHNEVQRIRRQLSEAYVRMGQFVPARKEITDALENDPGNDDLQSALQRIEAEIEQMEGQPDPLEYDSEINLDFSQNDGERASLIELDKEDASRTAFDLDSQSLPETDGNEFMAKFLVSSDFYRQDKVDEALAVVQAQNAGFSPEKPGASLLQEILRQATVEEEEDLYNYILDQTKFGFVPLDNYEVDRQILKMLPDQMTLGRLIVPFDLISRTLMVAVCNPFDVEGRNAVQSMLDYTIQWYFATPAAISKVLCEAYRIELPK